MPTDCEPWPGKTKADVVIVRSLAAVSCVTRAGVCATARKRPRPAILPPMHPSDRHHEC